MKGVRKQGSKEEEIEKPIWETQIRKIFQQFLLNTRFELL